MEQAVHPHPSMVDRLVELARRLQRGGRPAEAAELLETVASLSSHGDRLREEAARLRELSRSDDFDREFKRRNLEASHALGMAHIFERRGEFGRAVEMIDLAKLRTPFNYLAYTAAGFLHLRHGEPATALGEFLQARRLNPLDFRLAVETSRAAIETESYDTALDNAIDAMLLANWRSEREQEQERRRVETLSRLCHRSPRDMDALVRARTAALQKACDHVALSQARLFSASSYRRRATLVGAGASEQDNLLQRANELRHLGLFRHFADDQLIALAKVVEPYPLRHSHAIYHEGQPGADLFVVREGTVHITRRTPAGTQVLATCGPGSLFGEVSYIDRLERSTTAVGVGTGSAYRIPARKLDRAIQQDRELGVSLLWSFWQTLADKVRASNGQMSELFDMPLDQIATTRDGTGGHRVNLGESAKLDILREQGLSAQELRLLATYSREERFAPGSLIVAEGEPGDRLFIVVDGAVRISRMVPGAGEECLTILTRGEVFGEMALIDEQPRSADARAHSGGCTVFSVSRDLLEEVLSMDPDAAMQFLSLLCRLLCRRLRAMNERLVAWRLMSMHE
ncbi:MAG TPA: cyclic nucleotide-binding domain-containing protein [Candidatus Sulfomarinibacteraceae bacterium]|nr:cyclic nucleotide-binding domain-containing protein [Candidatus Sulfomarinibacteraceae bacterium]